jgi:hypothetical protein
MISLDVFLVFLAAASLPILFLWIASRWIEPEYRKTRTDEVATKQPAGRVRLVTKIA